MKPSMVKVRLTPAQVLGLRAFLLTDRPTETGLSCGDFTDGSRSRIHWKVADSLIELGLAQGRYASPGARPYGVQLTAEGRSIALKLVSGR